MENPFVFFFIEENNKSRKKFQATFHDWEVRRVHGSKVKSNG